MFLHMLQLLNDDFPNPEVVSDSASVAENFEKLRNCYAQW